MSLEAAIGRIDTILQLQQQIVDPTAAAGSTASTATSTGGSTSTQQNAATFAEMLAGAQSGGDSATTGATSATGLTDPISAGVSNPVLASTGTTTPTATSTATGVVAPTGTAAPTDASAGAPAQVQAMTDEADSLVGKPYVWGGGHSGWGPQPGYDCSGFVSAVLHAGGFLQSPQDTVSMPSAPGMAQGPGQYVTVYDRTGAGQQGHVIIDIAGQFYESGGGHGAWGGGGGVEKIGRPSAAYLATFDTLLHPQGL